MIVLLLIPQKVLNYISIFFHFMLFFEQMDHVTRHLLLHQIMGEMCRWDQQLLVKEKSQQLKIHLHSLSLMIPLLKADVCSSILPSCIKYDQNNLEKKRANSHTIKGWFSAPFIPPPLSFRWQDTKYFAVIYHLKYLTFHYFRPKGVVVNEMGATVGSLLGDGLYLEFSDPSVVGTFYVCLLILSQPDTLTYPIRDFGYSLNPYEYIYPLSN